jgi:hypothetical protein
VRLREFLSWSPRYQVLVVVGRPPQVVRVAGQWPFPSARAHYVAAATRPTPSRRGTFRRRSGHGFEVHAGGRGSSAHLMPRRLYSNQPVAQGGSPSSKGDEPPCNRSGKRQNAEHFQCCDCEPVQAVHFTPPAMTASSTLQAHQRCTRNARQLSSERAQSGAAGAYAPFRTKGRLSK